MAVPAYSQVDVQVRLNGPSGKPPLGVTSKFIDAPNIKAINIVIIALFLSSASLAVLIRTYTIFLSYVLLHTRTVSLGSRRSGHQQTKRS